MNHYFRFPFARSQRIALVICALALLAVVIGSAPLQIMSVSAAPENEFFTVDGTLAPGGGVNPVVPIFGSNRDFNFSLTITGGGPVSFTIQNAGGQTVWSGNVEAGETVWGSGTLTVGQNPLALMNTSGTTSSDFDLSFFTLPATPYTWAGSANGTGLNSHARVTFPDDGLYTFDLAVTGGQYQFFLDNNYIQKTVETSTSVTYFIPAGTHDLVIVQDTAAGAGWQVAISGVGGAADTLPYTKNGSGLSGMDPFFQEEWLPVYLSAATQVNLELVISRGAAPDYLTLKVFDTGQSQIANRTAISGETLWATLDLPAGTSLIHLTADGNNSGLLDYDLALHEIPDTDYTWSGVSNAAGLNSSARLNFPADGLYTFDLNVTNGRYQFLLDNEYIQKTVEANTSVTFFVPAGTHDLVIDQDTAAGAGWNVAVSFAAGTSDTLPYGKMGGDLGGTANDYGEEWLPIALDNGQTVNLSIATSGNMTGSLMVEVYGSSSPTPTHTVAPVLGTEKVWSNFPLQAGVNRLHIVASGGNLNAMSYDLVLEAVPPDSKAWQGVALAGGRNSSVMVDFPTGGLYRFEIENDTGFANLLLDNDLFGTRSTVNTIYDIDVTPGMHEVVVVQDTAFPVTNWSASIAPVMAGDSFFAFSGTLEPGESVMPQYPADADLDFNFALSVANGGPVNLTITDGSGATIWNGDTAQNEVLWGTETLTGGLNGLALTNNGAAAADVMLTLYHLPTVGYDWQGTSSAPGLNSHIRLNFPADGLYSFDYDVNSGAQYQFLVNSQYIQKTVEVSGTVTYFVPAGTHDLYLDQDTQGGTVDWSLFVADAGAASNTLPYMKEGGPLSGGSDFSEEWLPLNLAADTQANVALTLNGNASDSLDLAVGGFNVTVYGGETYWTSLDLAAGTTLLHLAETVSNTGSLDYELVVYPLPALPYTWDGSSAAMQGTNRNSSVRVQFPDDGLYTFEMGVDSGRYQFFLNDEYIQKTAESDTSATYFIPAGLHNLKIVQDSSLGADWDVTITPGAAGPDSLPYIKMGGALGGVGNDYGEEWMPLYIDEAAEANLEISVSGSLSDSLQLAVVAMNDSTVILDRQPLYGGETVWSTFAIPADGVRLYLLAEGANAAALNYDLTVDYLPQITGMNQDSYAWSGLSAGVGLNSMLRLDTQISGTYHVEVNMPFNGFVTLFVDGSFREGTAGPAARDFFYEFDVPLMAGLHSFRTQQDSTMMTSWIVTATLADASSPQITAVTPFSIPNAVPNTVSVMGSNFMPGGSLVIDGPGDPITLTATFVSANEVTAVVPAELPVGDYDVTWTNPDNKSGTLAAGMHIYEADYLLYLPFMAHP